MEEMRDAMMINVDGKRVALSDLVGAWKENGKLSEKAKAKLHGKKGENNTDMSRGAGGGNLDLLKSDPVDVITQSGKWTPVRGMVDA